VVVPWDSHIGACWYYIILGLHIEAHGTILKEGPIVVLQGVGST
jgi:hypothetical protein